MVGKRAGRNVPKLENRAARLPTLPGLILLCPQLLLYQILFQGE